MNKRGGGSAEILFGMLAIVLIVAIVLFPMFARSRESCRKSLCQSNIKQCAVALNTYWNDYDGHLPSSALVNHSKKWNQADFARFASVSGVLPAKGRPQTYTQVLYSHMKSKDYYFCNYDPADKTNSKTRVSYYWKTAFDKAWYGVDCKKPCRRESDFMYNAEQVVLYEHKSFHNKKTVRWFWSKSYSKPIGNGAIINVAFIDTHVKATELRNATSGDPNHPALQSNGEPMYFNYDNDKPQGPNNPLPPNVPAKYIDPSRYSDRL